MASLARQRMQGLDTEGEGPRVTVESQARTPLPNDRSVERVAAHAAAVAHSLAASGYQPRHLSLTFSESGDLVLVARLDHPDAPPEARPEARPEPRPLSPEPRPLSEVEGVSPSPSRRVRPAVLTRLVVGVTLGLLLGFLGLPRLELPRSVPAPAVFPTPLVSAMLEPQDQPNPAPPQPTVPATVAAAPTRVPPRPTPTPGPSSTTGVLFAERFVTPLAKWPNDPRGFAWFANGEYRLMARESGRFVATGVPLDQPLANARLSAQFHKIGGPAGGGYGLIVRDQSLATERDSRNQAGQYLVVEVGDRGDIGVWQRDQTRWIDIVPWTHSDAVHLDRESNALTVTTRGSALTFDVNGTVVADLTYPRLPSTGGVGIFVGGDLNEVALEWLRIETVD